MSENPHAQPHDPASGPAPDSVPPAPVAPSGTPAPAGDGGYAPLPDGGSVPPAGPGAPAAAGYAPPPGPGIPAAAGYAAPSGVDAPPVSAAPQGTGAFGGYGAQPHPGTSPWQTPGQSGPMTTAGAAPLGTLLDLGFTRRITPALAKIVHLALLAVAGIVTLLGILAAIGMFATAGDRFFGGPSWVLFGFAVLLLSPLVSFLVVAFGRFLLEAFLDQADRRHPDADR